MQKKAGNKPVDIRRSNYSAILQLFRLNSTLTTRDIMGTVNLSKTAITNLLNNLVQMSVIQPVGKGSSTVQGGKKPELYSLNFNYRYVVVIYFSHNECMCQLLNMKYHIISECRFYSSPKDEFTYSEILDCIKKGYYTLLEKSGTSEKQLCGVVLQCPGIVLHQEGILLRPLTFLSWENNLPLLDDVKKRIPTDVPFYVDNICRYIGYSELMLHSERRSKNIVTLFCSTTIGGSQISFGHLVHGRTGLVGEYGHITTDYSATTRCHCGNYGCFEMSVAESHVLDRIRQDLKIHTDSVLTSLPSHSLTIHDVFHAASAGDNFAQKHIDFIVRQFSILIYNMQISYDPDEIIIQGTYSCADKYFKDSLQETLGQMVLHNIPNHTKLSFSDFTKDPRDLSCAMTGAALFCYDQFFEQMSFIE